MKFELKHEDGAVLSIGLTDGRVSLVLSSAGELVTAFDLTEDEASRIGADLIGSAIEIASMKRFEEFKRAHKDLFDGVTS